MKTSDLRKSERMRHCIDARWQMRNWLDSIERRVLGIQHDRMPRFHRGQWVRFIGDPGVVQTRERPPRFGQYGQVLRLWPGGQLITVLFVGRRWPANLGGEEAEPLVGVPVGQPRDHLRKFNRRATASHRARENAETE